MPEANDWRETMRHFTKKANTRIPYASTLVQTKDDVNNELVKMENSKDIPLNFRF